MSENLVDKLAEVSARLLTMENRFSELGYDMTAVATSEYKKRFKIEPQAETFFGLFTALCIDTVDPWKKNRVRFFSPLFHKPDTPIKALPWALPVSAAGGFDDCGMSWVPPAGSTLCILFENGSRQSPYYIGTTWHMDRGADGQHNWGYNIKEYYDIHEGRRNGYLVGPNDGSQVFCQWNNESYNGYNIESIEDFENDPDAQRKITPPNCYGFKTVEKHGIKLVDGNAKCNYRGKRVEILSSTGNWLCMKDDWMHGPQTYVHPSCGATGPELDCTDQDGNPIEKTECEGELTNSSILGGHPSTPDKTKYGLDSNQGSNPYFKHANECRPFKGVGTPQNNKCFLPQSGVQIMNRSGATLVLDDSVEEPRGVPKWETSAENFDFGCNDKFLGKVMILTATGHELIMSDIEADTKLRGDQNFIRLRTATGNTIELNDHTVGKKEADCPPNLAGEKRGITIQSSSSHLIKLCDEENEQCSPARRSGGVPIAKAKKAFILVRSGYGIEFSIHDKASQEETQQQYMQLFCPQQKEGKGNLERGPHIVRLQEKPSGPGYILVRVGGDYVCSTYDGHFTFVGDKDKNPSDLLEYVSRNNVVYNEEFYFNKADVHAFLADRLILLMAGKDCKPVGWNGDKEDCGPCVFPVLCLTPKGVVASDRVYASASPDAGCISILHLTPFHSCKPWEGCNT